MSETTLEIQLRTTGGTTTARAVRRAGLIPGILYGRGREPLPFQVEMPVLRTALSGDAGRHAVLHLTIPGEPRPTPAIMKDYQVDPVRDRLIHVDLLAISMTERIVTPVAVHLEGEAPGVGVGGVLEQPNVEVEIEALPGDLPDAINVDISALGVGDSIRLVDIEPPAGVSWASDPETVLATVLQSTTAEDLVQIDEEEPDEVADAAEAQLAEHGEQTITGNADDAAPGEPA